MVVLLGDVLSPVDGNVACALLSTCDVGPIAAHGDDLGPVELDGGEGHVGRPLVGG